MTFLEDLQRSEARAEQLQQQLDEKQRQHENAVGDIRSLQQELGRASEALDEAKANSEADKRLIGDLRAQVAHLLDLEQDLNAARSNLRDLNETHLGLTQQHANTNEALEKTQAELDLAKEQLSAALSENERARVLLDAFNAKAEAEKVIAAA